MTKTIKEAAYEYLDKGMVVIPIKQRDKAPAITSWQKRTLEDVCIEQDFPEGAGRNMGVLLGSVSGGIVDIDLDCEEAIRIAPLLLPETKMIFG